MEKKKMSDKKIVIIGIWLIVIGIAFISGDYLMSKKQKAYETITFALSNMPSDIEQEIPAPDEDITDIVTEPSEDGDNQTIINKNYYVGRLEIPEINLVKGFASMDSPYNNVNQNVTIIAPSDYPDVDKGNLILAAHNGNGWNSYFRYVYKLEVGDMAYVYYNNVKYSYEIVSIYKVPKTGTVNIFRDFNKTTLTLVTCTKGDKTTQTVLIAELVEKE